MPEFSVICRYFSHNPSIAIQCALRGAAAHGAILNNAVAMRYNISAELDSL